MKQCPKACEMCGRPIVDVGAVVAVEGIVDESHQVWTCHRKVCDEKAVLQVDRGYARYRGDPARGPDVLHPLRGEIVVHVRQVQRVDVFMTAASPAGMRLLLPPGST
jgi:hypothetical protein